MNRFFALDGLRGIAAFVVVLWHFTIGFAPARLGTEPSGHGFTLIGSPVFFLFNGPAAVTLFFALSGFVLSHAFFATGDLSVLQRSAIKRYFRLVGMSVVAVMISYVFYVCGAYRYIPGATTEVPSSWFQTLAGSYLFQRQVSLWGALTQGTFFVFTNGDAYYNTNLWTMRFELFGSFMVFSLAALVRTMWPPAIVAIASALAILFYFISDYYYMLPFLIGLILAHGHARFAQAQTGPATTFLIAAASMLALSFYNGTGVFHFASHVNAADLDRWRCAVHTAAAAGLIWIAITNGQIDVLLRSRVPQFLGRISFAMYATHTLIFFAVTGRLYIFLQGRYGSDFAIATAFICSLAIIFPLSYALSIGDELWMRYVSRAIKAVTPPIKPLGHNA